MNNSKRINFLKNNFNVIVFDEDTINNLITKYEDLGFEPIFVVSPNISEESRTLSNTLSIYFEDDNKHEVLSKTKRVVFINEFVFNDILESDPTKNKSCCQWMVGLFLNFIKIGDVIGAQSYYDEDLPIANKYLKVFENNKRKKSFTEHCSKSVVLEYLTDYSNINQYKSLGQLYDSVDPFIERDVSVLENKIYEFVERGEAEIGFRDRKYTIYIPFTKDSSIVFDEFASWCTTKSDRSNFESYSGYKTPDGSISRLYIIIDNEFFNGELKNNSLYQFHFESSQFKNRKQIGTVDVYSEVLSKSEGVSLFFYKHLKKMAMSSGGIKNNKYLDFMVKFGWSEALFEIIDEYTPIIKILDYNVPKITNISKFKELQMMVVSNSNLHSLDYTIGDFKNLETLSLPNNKLKTLPREVGNLKSLIFLNVKGNDIKLPDEIKYLDKSNGGSLYRIAIDESIGEKELNRLRVLLPNTIINK